MTTFSLSQEELDTLKEVLENDIIELREEIYYTDRYEYREILKNKEQILEKILSVLKVLSKV